MLVGSFAAWHQESEIIFFVLMFRGLTWWRMRTRACHAAHQAARPALPHGLHAPSSASRQGLSDSHQVDALEEYRPRPLTWAAKMACISKAMLHAHAAVGA